jgi:hypothetical protein
MGTGSFPGVESGRGVTLTSHPLLVPKSKNRVELYLYSQGPSWPVLRVKPTTATDHILQVSAKVGLYDSCYKMPTTCGSGRCKGRFSHTMPFPCHAVLLRLSHLIYTVRPCFIHTYDAVPMPCHEYSFLKATCQGHGRVTAWERHGMCELASVVQRRHVGHLPAFSLFQLPRPVPGSLLSEAYQSQMQVASVKQNNVCHGREQAYYFGARK